jgi:iron complex transport system ATP-binding protein
MDRAEGLSIGTPEELARDGILGRFVERKGIHFDSNTLTIQIDKTA